MPRKFVPSLLILKCVLTHCIVNATLSGCQVCAQTGKCDKAYHSGPGQFCGYFQESGFVSKPCCCPLNSICKLSPFQCLCHIPDGRNYFDYGHSTWFEDSFGAIIFFLILLCLCCCCCISGDCCSSNSNRDRFLLNQDDVMPIAVPVHSSDVPYGSVHSNPPPTAPLSADPLETRRFGEKTFRSINSPSTGSGIASALGGFVVGEMLGQAIGAGRRDHHRHPRHGYDVLGDTGGFDIPGDTGRGGLDIPGDS